VDEAVLRRRGRAGDQRQRHACPGPRSGVVQPHIFAQDRAGRTVMLGDDMALPVVDVVDGLRRGRDRAYYPVTSMVVEVGSNLDTVLFE
jgi:hypothetical protein